MISWPVGDIKAETFLIIKVGTKQDSYVSTVSRLIQNRDPKSMLLEIQT